MRVGNEKEQECIPVGCVPHACCPYLPACTVPEGGVPARGVYLPGGCTCPGGVPAWGGVPAHVLPPLPLWTEFLTHATENITLPQTSFAGGKNVYEYGSVESSSWVHHLIWNHC